jgi:hypothetical protein
MKEPFTREDSVYSRVKIEEREVEGHAIVVAEAAGLRDAGITRDHMRIIGKGNPSVSGHPIIYSDTYTGAPADSTFAYARHRVDQSTFLTLLEAFLHDRISVEFPELIGKPVHGVIQTQELEGTTFESHLAMISMLRSVPIRFARLYFPFGDMTIEFNNNPIISSDEFFCTQKGGLARRIESPLFAFDASRSDIWASFLVDIHWAANLIDREILLIIIKTASRVTA